MSFAQSGSGSPAAAAADSPEVLERIRAELDLVDLIARQLSRSLKRAVDFDDLLSAGREGLFEAARHFNPARGASFRAYANLRIRGAMIDGVRHQALSRRAFERLRDLEIVNDAAEGVSDVRRVAGAQPSDQAELALTDQIAALATACALQSDDAEASEQDTPEEQYARAEERQRVREAVAALEPPLGRLLEARYFEGRELEDIARELGLERSWVGRMCVRAQKDLVYRIRERL